MNTISGYRDLARRRSLKLLTIGAACLFAAGNAWMFGSNGIQQVNASGGLPGAPALADNKKKAKAAFTEAAKVFFSPRCANCHPVGDTPLQGDESRVHDLDVMRGPEGRGTEELQCAMCHMEENTEGENMPPGVPDWHMPPANQKMVFQGITAAQLCQNLKDPLKNGGRKSAKEAVEHLVTDPKVLWAWSPGTGRTSPSMTHADFIKKMNEWVANGAACPN